MKKLSLLLILCFCTPAFAQNTDGVANKILHELAGKYGSYSSMQIDYTYKVVSDGKTTSTLTGRADIKGSKYHITFGDQTFYCNGVSMWHYQKSTNEVSVYTYEESDDDVLNPAKLLKTWQLDYKPKYIRDDTERNKPVQIIDLTPKKVQSYYKIRLIIDKSKKEIIHIVLYEKNNTTYHYYFDRVATNVTIPDNTFVFDKSKFPKVEINDMR